jgi:hypothetical protein
MTGGRRANRHSRPVDSIPGKSMLKMLLIAMGIFLSRNALQPPSEFLSALRRPAHRALHRKTAQLARQL